MSARLSYSLPKALSVRVRRAMRPSSVSKIIAANTPCRRDRSACRSPRRSRRSPRTGSRWSAGSAAGRCPCRAGADSPSGLSVATAAILAGDLLLRCRHARPLHGQRPLDEALPVPDQHHEGDPRGGGGHQSPADAARRPHPPPGGRPLQLAADGPARAAEGRAHRARGDEPRRGARARDAGGAARGAVAGVGPLERVRPGAAALQGPPRARLRARARRTRK